MKKLFTLLFFAIILAGSFKAATFSSVSSGTWSAPATWSITGSDADGIPDSDDDVTINGGHSIDLVVLQNNFKTLNINSSATLNLNGKALSAYGNLTVDGVINGSFYYLRFMAPSVFSSLNTFTNDGSWHVYAPLTINAGTSIVRSNHIYIFNSQTVSNFGSVKISTGTVYSTSASLWKNEINSFLQMGYQFTSSQIFDFSAPNNTLVCHGNCKTLPNSTFYNLSLSASSTKTATSNVTVLNNLTILGNSSTNILDLNNFDLTVGGNWTNAANTNILNQGTITFNGSSVQNLSRTSGIESINNLVLNGTGSVNINTPLNVPNSLTVNSTMNIVATSNAYALRLQGSFTNNGTINCQQSNVLFNGSTNQSVSGSSNTQFYNLTLSNSSGLVINSPQSLSNALTILNGNFNSNGNFTLLSNSSSTARIAPKTNAGASISGNMTIQKYISARASGYHDMSSPVQNTTIMDWDDELYMSGIGPDDGIPGRAGVDGSAGGTYSVFKWDETTCNTAPDYGWSIVTGSGTPLVNGSAYEIYIADDLTNFNGGTIDTKGVPQFGNKTVNLSYTSSQGAYAGTNLLGNPFASAIDFGACTKTNVTGNVLILDNSGNYTDYGPNPIIPPHQGFWVYAAGTGAQVVFAETAKSTNVTTTFYRTIPNYGIKLVFSSPSSPYFNENTINFNSNGSNDFDIDLDALYLKSPNKISPAIFMLTNSDAKLVTNTINSVEDEVTIPLAIYTPKEATYYIEPNVLTIDNYNYVWLENTKTGKKYDLNSSISIMGENNKTNYDYVLRLSKNSQESQISQTVFDNDIIVFATENDINLKSVNTTHYITEVNVFDISGKLMFKQNNLTVESGQATKIDISNLATGVYIVNVTDILGHVKTQKVIH